jgi:hypothetical protein
MRYIQGALRHPRFVGCHWFQFNDQHTTGRVFDGENAQIGFTDICDTPYPEIINAARALGNNMYAYRMNPGNADSMAEFSSIDATLASGTSTGANKTADFSADYAKVFGTTVTADTMDDAPNNIDTSVCGGLGLPLIAGIMLMVLMLTKLDD